MICRCSDIQNSFDDIIIPTAITAAVLLMLEDIYKNRVEDSLVDEPLVIAIIAFFLSGFKKNVSNPPTTTVKNITLFTVFKNYHNKKELIKIIKKNPNISFDDFKKEADKVNTLYNIKYLKTEYGFIEHQGKQFEKWNEFIRDGVEFLEYKTVGDNKVRFEHSLLDGTVKDLTDDFWKYNHPPIVNGKISWNCRCYLIPATNPYNSFNLSSLTNSKKVNTNIGITGKVIPEEVHPYFNVEDGIKQKLVAIANRLLN